MTGRMIQKRYLSCPDRLPVAQGTCLLRANAGRDRNVPGIISFGFDALCSPTHPGRRLGTSAFAML